MIAATELPSLVESFFTKRLVAQRNVSANTIAAYRDTFRLLFVFAEQKLHRAPSQLNVAHLNAELICSFLDGLERKRHNSATTRNLRLAAIRSFFRYAAMEVPEHGALIQRVLAIPPKRCDRKIVGFLTQAEVTAILAAVDQSTWCGRRDYAMLLVMMQTGLRLAEVTGLRQKDVVLGPGAHVHCQGKGRKERCTPLTRSTAKVLKAWQSHRGDTSDTYVFPSSRGGRLSHDAMQDLVTKHVSAARSQCPSLTGRKITPHMLRHTAAMELLQAGIDRSLIAIWLGHESVDTTQTYLDANLSMKEQVLAQSHQPNGKLGRYKPGDQLLTFLRKL